MTVPSCQEHIILYFGSFNPIHIAHLAIAQHALTETRARQLWFVVSPQNPFKRECTDLLLDTNRLVLCQLAIEDNPHFHVSDVEFTLPQPSYTADTLQHLRTHYPDEQFAILMGSDSYVTLPRWKQYADILANHRIYVYDRPEWLFDRQHVLSRNTHYLSNTPLFTLSATLIRDRLRAGKSVRYLLPLSVEEEILRKRYYTV